MASASPQLATAVLATPGSSSAPLPRRRRHSLRLPPVLAPLCAVIRRTAQARAAEAPEASTVQNDGKLPDATSGSGVVAAPRPSRRSLLGEGMIKVFNGPGVGVGVFVGVGYGLGFGTGPGVGRGAPYKHGNLMFGPCMGTVLGIGVGVGRFLGINYLDPDIDWEEVVYGNRSWGVQRKQKMQR